MNRRGFLGGAVATALTACVPATFPSRVLAWEGSVPTRDVGGVVIAQGVPVSQFGGDLGSAVNSGARTVIIDTTCWADNVHVPAGVQIVGANTFNPGKGNAETHHLNHPHILVGGGTPAWC